MTCRIAVAAGVNEVVELTPEQYIHLLNVGDLEPVE